MSHKKAMQRRASEVTRVGNRTVILPSGVGQLKAQPDALSNGNIPNVPDDALGRRMRLHKLTNFVLAHCCCRRQAILLGVAGARWSGW